MLERAQLYLQQWHWDAAIKLASHLLKGTNKGREGTEEISGASFLDIPLLLQEGIPFYASRVITRASFQVRDYAVTQQFASPYYKALIAIAKADFEVQFGIFR
jgi:outer membrane PBP1 activator LpoA protein